jgi:predicted DNA-binding transcriptional regulator YafY
LIASGVPILGEAGVGYQLSPSYRLPPMTFNSEELEALVLGMRMVEAWGDSGLRLAARGIFEKVNTVVSEQDKAQLDNTALFSLRFGVQRAASQNLGELRRAVNERRVASLDYEDERGISSIRKVRGLGLYFWGRNWTLAAWCELRQDFRNFRTDRVRKVELTGESFELVSPCTLDDYARAMVARDVKGGDADSESELDSVH